MRELVLILAAAGLVSCSRPVSPPGSDLAEVTAGRVAGAPQACIQSNRVSGIRAIDEQTLAYGSGEIVYINRLGGPCPGIQPLSTLIVEAQGTQYCRGDRVRGRELGATIAGPTCILGNWVPYRR